MTNLCGVNKGATLQNLARYATYLFTLQEGSSCMNITSQGDSLIAQKAIEEHQTRKSTSSDDTYSL